MRLLIRRWKWNEKKGARNKIENMGRCASLNKTSQKALLSKKHVNLYMFKNKINKEYNRDNEPVYLK